jgi:putative drug exporter of the RND superfamily
MTLAGSLALLAPVPVRPFRELAFSMAIGVLVVRLLLVPSLIALLARVSWWPGRCRPGPPATRRPLEVRR